MPSFKLMLADTKIPTPDQLRFPLMVSYKIDGCRATAINGVAYSRKMLAYENPFVQKWALDNADVLKGLDGELVVGEPRAMFEGDDVFNRTSGPLGKMTGEPDFSFYVFERHNMSGIRAWERYMELRESFGGAYDPVPRVKLVQQWLVHSIAGLQALMAEALELGYEGLILKSPRGLYKNGRSSILEGILMKWKEWAESEAVILGVKQGTTNTNPDTRDELGHAKRSSAKAGKIPRDSIGSWQVRDIYSGREFNCPPGSQTEEALKAMWLEHLETPHTGRVMTYKFQKAGTLFKPRFPGMVRFRPVSDLAPDRPTPYLFVGK
jgi:DNA ligase-1